MLPISFSRSSRNIVANWWWTVDKWLLTAIIFLLGCGILLSFSASPAVGQDRYNSMYHFVVKQSIFLCIAVGCMLFFSMQGLKWTRRLAILGYVGTIVLLIVTLFFGVETKGARRWLNFVFFQLQPSEFLKPTFIVFTAWLFEMQHRYKNFYGIVISCGLCAFTCLLLLLQPDYGMTVVVAAIWFAQLFLAGFPIKRLVIVGVVLIIAFTISYFALPHVQVRVEQMLAGMGGEPSYQVKRSLEAFKNGGLFGVGVGEGVVKWHIPDAHTDFIFPVAAEEYGMFLCLLIVGAYALVVIRSMWLSGKEDNMFIVLSVCGLALSFGLQAFVNMASTLQLGPTKGMALPLISYGGSALLGASVGIGMLLSLTRKNIHAENKDDEG